MIFENDAELRDRIHSMTGRRLEGDIPIFVDSSAYMGICGGSVLRLEDNDYFVLSDTREGRFGIDDQPKFWVKYAVDLTTGARKILKLVFHEQFTITFGLIKVRCTRNPSKESAILEAVRGHPRFMQGITALDRLGHQVRVIDQIRGRSLYDWLESTEVDHETYVSTMLPQVMKELVQCIDAIADLHALGQHHGDIRNDHILIEAETGVYKWIDFDYQVNFADYDVWSMGNVLNYVVGRGMHTFREVQRNPEAYPYFDGKLEESDALALYKHRIANLGRLFPYLPAGLSEILSRFSLGTDHPYEDLRSQAADLRSVFGIEAPASPRPPVHQP